MELFFITLNSFVEWESLEGVPHIKMQYVRTGANVSIEKMEDIQESSLSLLHSLDFNLKKGINGFEVVLDSVLEESLKKNLEDNSSMLGYEQEGEWITLNGSDRIVNDHKSDINNFLSPICKELPFTYIQGKRYEFKIEPIVEDKKIDKNDLSIKPKYLKYIKYEIERKIKEQLARRSIIEARSDLDYAEAVQ